MKIDLTPLCQSAIVLIAALITYKLVPYIKSKVTKQQYDNLTAIARIAVYSAEQIFNSGDNAQKFDYAMKYISDAGFNLDTEKIRAAIEKAVYELSVEQQIINHQYGINKDAQPPDETTDEI